MIPTHKSNISSKIVFELFPQELNILLNILLDDLDLAKVPSINGTLSELKGLIFRSEHYYSIEPEAYLEQYKLVKGQLSDNPLRAYQQMTQYFLKEKYMKLSSLPRDSRRCKIYVIPKNVLSFDDLGDTPFEDLDEDVLEYSRYGHMYTYGEPSWSLELVDYIQTNFGPDSLVIGDVIILENDIDRYNNTLTKYPNNKDTIHKMTWGGKYFESWHIIYDETEMVRDKSYPYTIKDDHLPITYWNDSFEDPDWAHISFHHPLKIINFKPKIIVIDNNMFEYIDTPKYTYVRVIDKISSSLKYLTDEYSFGILNPLSLTYRGINFDDPDQTFKPNRTLIVIRIR